MAIRRAKGTGSIRKMGKSYYWRITINGKKTVKRLDATTEKEADQEATRLYTIATAKTQEEVAIFAGRARNIIKKANSLPLEKAFKVFKNNPSRPSTLPATLARHLLAWNEFIGVLNDNNPAAKALMDVTIDDAENYAAWLSDKSAKIYNSRIGSMKLIFRILERQSGLKENPFKFIKKKIENPKSKKELNDDQLIEVFEAIDKKYSLSIPHRDEMKILFRIGAYTGMRLKDCALLENEHVNLRNKTIGAKPCKTSGSSGKRVIIPIHDDLFEMLKNIDKKQKYVLPNVADRYLRNPSGVDLSACRIMWYVVGKKPKAGMLPERVKGYGFHSLRHSFVSFCANAGVPLAIVQEIVGHNNVAVTRIYSHLSLDSLREAVAAIPGKSPKVNKREAARLKRLQELTVLLKENPEIIIKTLNFAKDQLKSK